MTQKNRTTANFKRTRTIVNFKLERHETPVDRSMSHWLIEKGEYDVKDILL